MTPEPTDLLRGARRTLTDVILPALSDPFAIEQAKTVLRVLVHLEAVIDEAYPLEWEEARDLGRFLEAAAPLLAAVGDDAGAQDVRQASATTPVGETPLSYRALRDANVARKELVATLIRGPLRERRDDDLARSVAAQLDDLVRSQVEREKRWTSPKPKADSRKTRR